jgi:hypothetical protein
MPSGAPDGKGPSAGNGDTAGSGGFHSGLDDARSQEMSTNAPSNMGGVMGQLDDRDIATLTDTTLAAEAAEDAKNDKYLSISLNLLGMLLGVPPMMRAVGNLAMGNISSAVGTMGTAMGLPAGLTTAGLSLAAGSTPEQAMASGLMGTAVGVAAPAVGGAINSAVSGLTGSAQLGQLAAMTGTPAAMNAVSSNINSSNNTSTNANAANNSNTNMGGGNNAPQGMLTGRSNQPYNYNQYANLYNTPQGMLQQNRLG